MPGTSEGYEETGLEPNSAVAKEELDPIKFDAQTAEIFQIRLNKVLDLPERTPFEAALDSAEFMRKNYHALLQMGTETEVAEAEAHAELIKTNQLLEDCMKRAEEDWKYLHTRVQGLKCIEGTWKDAIDEITAFVHGQQQTIQTLTEKLKAQPESSSTVPSVPEAVHQSVVNMLSRHIDLMQGTITALVARIPIAE